MTLLNANLPCRKRHLARPRTENVMNQTLKPTLEKVTELATNPPAALVSLADSLLVTMAMKQLKEEKVNQYATKVLAEMQAHIAKKWVDLGVDDQIILDPKSAYLLDDEKAAVYYARCEQERIAAGMTVEKEGNCPALEADSLFRAARDAFIDALTPYTAITIEQARMSVAMLDKLSDWGLRLLTKHIDPHKRYAIPQPA